MDYGPPGSSVHEVFQARILEWASISNPGDLPVSEIESMSPALQADSLSLCHLRSPEKKRIRENKMPGRQQGECLKIWRCKLENLIHPADQFFCGSCWMYRFIIKPKVNLHIHLFYLPGILQFCILHVSLWSILSQFLWKVCACSLLCTWKNVFQLSQHSLLKRLSLYHYIVFAPLMKIS